VSELRSFSFRPNSSHLTLFSRSLSQLAMNQKERTACRTLHGSPLGLNDETSGLGLMTIFGFKSYVKRGRWRCGEKRKKRGGGDGGMGLKREGVELNSRSCRDFLKIKSYSFLESLLRSNPQDFEWY